MIKKFKFSKIIKTVPLVYDPGQGHQDLGGGEATVWIQHQEFPDDVDGVTWYSVIPEIGDNISNSHQEPYLLAYVTPISQRYFLR